MDNRFNLNEEEKNHIRGLHNINVISEQVRNIPGGRVGLAYYLKRVKKKKF